MKKIAIGVAGVVALAAAALFFLRSSDEEKIEKMLRECADAAEKGDAEGILRHLDPACTFDGSSYSSLCERLRREVERVRGAKIDIGVASQVANDEADAGLQVSVRAAQHVLAEAKLRLKLRKVGGEWRIVQVDEVR